MSFPLHVSMLTSVALVKVMFSQPWWWDYMGVVSLTFPGDIISQQTSCSSDSYVNLFSNNPWALCVVLLLLYPVKLGSISLYFDELWFSEMVPYNFTSHIIWNGWVVWKDSRAVVIWGGLKIGKEGWYNLKKYFLNITWWKPLQYIQILRIIRFWYLH